MMMMMMVVVVVLLVCACERFERGAGGNGQALRVYAR